MYTTRWAARVSFTEYFRKFSFLESIGTIFSVTGTARYDVVNLRPATKLIVLLTHSLTAHRSFSCAAAAAAGAADGAAAGCDEHSSTHLREHPSLLPLEFYYLIDRRSNKVDERINKRTSCTIRIEGFQTDTDTFISEAMNPE